MAKLKPKVKAKLAVEVVVLGLRPRLEGGDLRELWMEALVMALRRELWMEAMVMALRQLHRLRMRLLRFYVPWAWVARQRLLLRPVRPLLLRCRQAWLV